MKNPIIFSFIFLIAIFAISCGSDDASNKGEKEEKVIRQEAPSDSIFFSVMAMDSTGNQHTLRIYIQDRQADENRLIRITRYIREMTGWKDKCVFFFQLQQRPEADAWATIGYLPKCPECATHKDMNGDLLEYHLLGMSKGYADSLSVLQLDTIPGKQLIGYYLDDTWRAKVALYNVPDKPGKVLMARLYPNSHSLDWLTLKHTRNQDRYYYDEHNNDDENPYIIVYKHEKGGSVYHMNSDDGVSGVNELVEE